MASAGKAVRGPLSIWLLPIGGPNALRPYPQLGPQPTPQTLNSSTAKPLNPARLIAACRNQKQDKTNDLCVILRTEADMTLGLRVEGFRV